jgi:hypothetical protein
MAHKYQSVVSLGRLSGFLVFRENKNISVNENEESQILEKTERADRREK